MSSSLVVSSPRSPPPPQVCVVCWLLIWFAAVTGVVIATAAAALDCLWLPLQLKTITSRWRTGSNHCCRKPLHLLPGRRSEGRSMRQRPLIFSIAVMVAGGDDGLPWRQAGQQWRFAAHFDCYLICSMVCEFFGHLQTTGGQKLCQFCQRYRMAPHVRYAVASRKILIPLWRECHCVLKWGGGGRGKKVMVKFTPPHQSVVPLFFVVVAQRIFSDIFTVSKILAGNSPAGPPNFGKITQVWASVSKITQHKLRESVRLLPVLFGSGDLVNDVIVAAAMQQRGSIGSCPPWQFVWRWRKLALLLLNTWSLATITPSKNGGGDKQMHLRCRPFQWPCGGVEAIHLELPDAACPGLLWKPLDAAIGQPLAPYRLGGRQGNSKQIIHDKCTHFDGHFSSSWHVGP